MCVFLFLFEFAFALHTCKIDVTIYIQLSHGRYFFYLSLPPITHNTCYSRKSTMHCGQGACVLFSDETVGTCHISLLDQIMGERLLILRHRSDVMAPRPTLSCWNVAKSQNAYVNLIHKSIVNLIHKSIIYEKCSICHHRTFN